MKNTETLVDENGIEVLVTYTYENTDEAERGMYDVELKSVEIIFGGTGIDVLPVMNEKQKDVVIGKLTFE